MIDAKRWRALAKEARDLLFYSRGVEVEARLHVVLGELRGMQAEYREMYEAGNIAFKLSDTGGMIVRLLNARIGPDPKQSPHWDRLLIKLHDLPHPRATALLRTP